MSKDTKIVLGAVCDMAFVAAFVAVLLFLF